MRARGRGGEEKREVERTTSCAPPRLHLWPRPSDGVSVPFAATFSRLAGCAGPGTAEAARRRHRGPVVRLLQDGRVTGGGELAASVRGTLIGLKKGDKEGLG